MAFREAGYMFLQRGTQKRKNDRWRHWGNDGFYYRHEKLSEIDKIIHKWFDTEYDPDSPVYHAMFNWLIDAAFSALLVRGGANIERHHINLIHHWIDKKASYKKAHKVILKALTERLLYKDYLFTAWG